MNNECALVTLGEPMNTLSAIGLGVTTTLCLVCSMKTEKIVFLNQSIIHSFVGFFSKKISL